MKISVIRKITTDEEIIAFCYTRAIGLTVAKGLSRQHYFNYECFEIIKTEEFDESDFRYEVYVNKVPVGKFKYKNDAIRAYETMIDNFDKVEVK